MKVVSLLLFVCACGTSDSSALLTKGITPEITVSTKGDGKANVVAELFEGAPLQLIFVDLMADDELVASTGGTSMTLHQNQLLNIIAYEASFSTGNPGDEFTIDFQRTLDDGAPSSTVTLPTPFTLDAVATTSARTAAINVTYAPSGTADMMSWQATGECIQTATGAAMADSGAFTIPANTFMIVGSTTSCTVTLNVTRQRTGVVDAHYRSGGQILGEQVRTAMFTSTP